MDGHYNRTDVCYKQKKTVATIQTQIHHALYMQFDMQLPWAAEGGLGWGQNDRGSGDGSHPAGSRGGAPVGGLGDEVP